jgi:hypothetical protein
MRRSVPCNGLGKQTQDEFLDFRSLIHPVWNLYERPERFETTMYTKAGRQEGRGSSDEGKGVSVPTVSSYSWLVSGTRSFFPGK